MGIQYTTTPENSIASPLKTSILTRQMPISHKKMTYNYYDILLYYIVGGNAVYHFQLTKITFKFPMQVSKNVADCISTPTTDICTKQKSKIS